MSCAHRSNVPHTFHGSFNVAITVSGCTARSVIVTPVNSFGKLLMEWALPSLSYCLGHYREGPGKTMKFVE